MTALDYRKEDWTEADLKYDALRAQQDDDDPATWEDDDWEEEEDDWDDDEDDFPPDLPEEDER